MAQPLTDAINALTRYANETTGQSDTTLSDAVETLVEGYGQGGGGDELVGFVDGTLTTFSNDEITSVRKACFRECSNLTEISLPNCVSLGAEAFYNCTSLTKLNLPKVETVTQSSAFTYVRCPLVLPKFKGGMYNKFSAYRGTVVDFGEETYTVDNYSFTNSKALKVVVLRSPTLAPLANIGAFNDTPFASNGTGGKLYVPQALISSYQSANNWSTILGYANNQILPIEGSQYEHYYADGTPIE